MDQLAIENPFHRGEVRFLPETDSTMDDARALWEQSPRSGLVVATSYQRRGRGRTASRSWYAEPNESLMFTVALCESDVGGRPGDLPLRIGCAIATYLRIRGILARVKWPNDILVRGRKIAGILCETARGGYLIGIGLNCNQTRFPAELKGLATSVRMETCFTVDPLTLLAPVLAQIHRFVRGSALPYLQQLLWGLGEEVAVRSQAATVFGRIAGVDADGALVLAAASGERRMISGEIVRFR